MKKIILLITILILGLFAFSKQIEVKGIVSIKNVNDSVPILIRNIDKFEIHNTDSILKDINKHLSTSNNIISSKLDLIEKNQKNTINWSFWITLFISVLALILAIKASLTSRITTIISILQDFQNRESRKEIFGKNDILTTKEIEDPDNKYRNNVEIVCQSFDTVYSMYNRTIINIYNPVTKLIESYKRPIIICYLKSYPIINNRILTQNHKGLWNGFEQLYNKVSKNKINNDIAEIIKSNGKNISFNKLEKVKSLNGKINKTHSKKELYNILLSNIDLVLFK